jgi:hypothetical protein
VKTVFALLLCVATIARAQEDPTHAAAMAKFREMQAKAPKGYPTLFHVDTASVDPGTMFVAPASCVMLLETEGQIYRVSGGPGMMTGCTIFQPGDFVYGHVHRVLGMVVDILDMRQAKPKSRRYTVNDVTLVDPKKQ